MIIAIALMIGTLLVIKAVTAKKHKGSLPGNGCCRKAFLNRIFITSLAIYYTQSFIDD